MLVRIGVACTLTAAPSGSALEGIPPGGSGPPPGARDSSGRETGDGVRAVPRNARLRPDARRNYLKRGGGTPQKMAPGEPAGASA
jgi:hypothetical protein